MPKTQLVIPTRLAWAAGLLPIRPSDHVLEAGCGRGIALSLVCRRLTTGRAVGLDRSATAIAAAATLNWAHINAGKLRLVAAPLHDPRLDEQFDVIFAVNMNVFWLKPERELAIVRSLLAEEGKLLLFYEPPSAGQASRIMDTASGFLVGSGFEIEQIVHADLGTNVGVCITAR